MKKRTRKPPVEPAIGREWLRRHEDHGEPVAEIARTAGYDLRTVKKQLDLMRQERDARQARQLVLKGALESHYADLCTFAEKLRANLLQYPPALPSSLRKDDPLWAALREHLSRAPVWRAIDKLERLIPQYDAAMAALRTRIEREAESLASLQVVPSGDKAGLLPSFSQAVAYHLEAGIRGSRGLTGVGYDTEASDLGIVIRMGSYGLAIVPRSAAKAQQARVEKACSSLMEKGLQWQEHATLAKIVNDIQSVQKELNEELTTVILRRVLPGRCVYCPY